MSREKDVRIRKKEIQSPVKLCYILVYLYRGADKSLARAD